MIMCWISTGRSSNRKTLLLDLVRRNVAREAWTGCLLDGIL